MSKLTYHFSYGMQNFKTLLCFGNSRFQPPICHINLTFMEKKKKKMKSKRNQNNIRKGGNLGFTMWGPINPGFNLESFRNLLPFCDPAINPETENCQIPNPKSQPISVITHTHYRQQDNQTLNSSLPPSLSVIPHKNHGQKWEIPMKK